MENEAENVNDPELKQPENDGAESNVDTGDVKPVGGLFKDWFVEYASYVILERAIPALEDGLKPVHHPSYPEYQ